LEEDSPLIASLNQPVTELVARGIALHQRGDLANAEQCYLQIMAREPRHSDALHLLGVLKGQQGDYSNGARLIDEAISLKPRMSAYHNNLGNLLARSGDAAGAEKSYRRALRVDPQNADAHLNLGKLQFERGDREARRSLKTAQRLSARSVEAQMSVGRLEEREGNAQLALNCYLTATKLNPSFAPAFIAAGNAQLLLDKTREAEESYRTAVRLNPESPDAHFNLANVLREDGRVLEAIELYRIALDFSPKGASDIQNNLGLALSELGQHREAKTAITKSIEIAGDSSDGWSNLGNLMRADGRLEEAAEIHRKVTELSPDNAAGWNNLGATLADLESIDDAEAAFRKATLLDPKSDEAFFNLGKHLSIFGDEQAAVEMLEHALSLNPQNAAAYTQLGFVAQNRGQLSEAADFYRKSLTLSRDSSIARHNLGSVQSSLGNVDGLNLMEETVREQPDSAELHWGFGERLLLHQRFHEGWKEYEWRKQVDKFVDQHRSFDQPQWDGSPLDGKTILLYAEQGQGDTLQFARYAELVAQRGGRVVLEVQRSLKSLLQGLPGVAECIAQGDALPEFVTYAPLMSLPYLFDTNAGTIPPPSSSFSERFASPVESNSALQVGIVWAGGSKDKRDRLRSTSLAQWSELATIDGIEFTSLQAGEPAEQANEEGNGFRFVGDCGSVKDFADTAAIIAGLDLVITVDTAVAHLAGTMGKPVWILLYNPVDWRWGLEGEQSPWYPTARLFRQFNQEGWTPVFERVAASLRSLADAHQPIETQSAEATT
jgi:tetratricopeptide (TPR) repeat protein